MPDRKFSAHQEMRPPVSSTCFSRLCFRSHQLQSVGKLGCKLRVLGQGFSLNAQPSTLNNFVSEFSPNKFGAYKNSSNPMSLVPCPLSLTD